MTDKIPAELKQIKQWTHSFSPDDLKRPYHYHYEPNGSLTFDLANFVAKRDGILKGFYVTRNDDYVLGDIDHVETPDSPWEQIPLELTMLLRSYPTYIESSPSGKGLRFIYKLKPGSKARTVGSYFLLNKAVSDANGYDPKGFQVNFDKPWMTITGNATSFSVPEIPEIDLVDLEPCFAIRYPGKKTNELRIKQADIANLPSMAVMRALLHSLPLDQNLRVQRAYQKVFDERYEHYAYWLKIMMAMQNFGELSGQDVECLHEFTVWSRDDTTAYTGDEDVTKHWLSISTKEDGISYLSLIKMANMCRLKWPMPRKQTKAEVESGAARKPLITEYVNFKTLVDFYCIKLYRDEDNPNVLYVSGDADIIAEYFMMFMVKDHYGKYYGPLTKDTLTPSLYKLSQDKGFTGISHNQINQFVKTYLAETLEVINLVRLYFDTPFKDLPPAYQINAENYNRSTYEFLYEALDIDYQTHTDRDREDEMYKAYYRCWLMGFVRNLYYRDTPHSNNCVLLLTGPEQIRKTSHFQFLLPEFMREDYIALTTHGFSTESSMRDVTKLAATNLVLFWDEFEQYITADTESNFKKVIDGNPQKIIDKYEVIEKTVVPRSIYGATSNLREFKLGSEGSRRIFNIPVKWVDTDHMNTVCWHRLINDLRERIRAGLMAGEVPWLLTRDQLTYQMELHKGIRAKNTLDYALYELFDFDEKLNIEDGSSMDTISSMQSDKTGRFRTTKDVSDTLMRYGFGSIGIKRPALIKSLERLCGDYTGTQKYPKYLIQPKCRVFKGCATQGPHQRWLLPPMRREAAAVFTTNFEGI